MARNVGQGGRGNAAGTDQNLHFRAESTTDLIKSATSVQRGVYAITQNVLTIEGSIY